LPKGFCAKNWTKIDPNDRVKPMFFPRIRRTLPSKPRNEDQATKPRKWPFMPLKHASLVPTNHITITINLEFLYQSFLPFSSLLLWFSRGVYRVLLGFLMGSNIDWLNLWTLYLCWFFNGGFATNLVFRGFGGFPNLEIDELVSSLLILR
jgi:hypothetical protein